jgi:hypothetical protein
MRIIHFTKERLGSLDWELPVGLTAILNAMSKDENAVVTGIIEGLMRQAILTIHLAMLHRAPVKLSEALVEISATLNETTKKIEIFLRKSLQTLPLGGVFSFVISDRLNVCK